MSDDDHEIIGAIKQGEQGIVRADINDIIAWLCAGMVVSIYIPMGEGSYDEHLCITRVDDGPMVAPEAFRTKQTVGAFDWAVEKVEVEVEEMMGGYGKVKMPLGVAWAMMGGSKYYARPEIAAIRYALPCKDGGSLIFDDNDLKIFRERTKADTSPDTSPPPPSSKPDPS